MLEKKSPNLSKEINLFKNFHNKETPPQVAESAGAVAWLPTLELASGASFTPAFVQNAANDCFKGEMDFKGECFDRSLSAPPF